ncbi:hypothetical protein F5I97DRAFT_335504 [Phlebopus sp. FC_14]|nr:hypothetical protein F5I97DRAFT_335504 [Phlebopus sp. FC_14]
MLLAWLFSAFLPFSLVISVTLMAQYVAPWNVWSTLPLQRNVTAKATSDPAIIPAACIAVGILSAPIYYKQLRVASAMSKSRMYTS